jgi:hypothetical protein
MTNLIRPAAARAYLMSGMATALCALGAPSAHAGQLYTYAGAPYSTITHGTCLTTSLHVSLRLTFHDKLPASATALKVTPKKWVASDGVHQFSGAKSALTGSSFTFWTDVNGVITAWEAQADLVKGSNVFYDIVSNGQSSLGGSDGDSAIDEKCKPVGKAQNTTAGVWTQP